MNAQVSQVSTFSVLSLSHSYHYTKLGVLQAVIAHLSMQLGFNPVRGYKVFFECITWPSHVQVRYTPTHAGLGAHKVCLVDMQESTHRKLMEVDLFAPWILTHDVLPGEYF